MAHSIDPAIQFGTLFAALPWQIVDNICKLLPMHIISGVFLKAPSLRSFIIDQYYSDEIRLYLDDADGEGEFNCFYEPSVSHMIGLVNTNRFLAENADIVPKKFTIFPGLKYIGLEDVLQRFHQVLSKAQRLEIKFPRASPFYCPKEEDPSKEIMDHIFALRNLRLLEAWYRNGHFELLPKHEGLAELVLSSIGEIDWNRITLPPNLSCLELNVHSGLTFEQLWSAPEDRNERMSYDQLFNLLWTVPPTLSAPGTVRCSNLTKLTLSNCKLRVLSPSIFPSTLNYLIIQGNAITSILHSGTGPFWLENIEDLDLTNNRMIDAMVGKLSQLGWPCRLKSLRLCNNAITSLKCLYNLPETLRLLSLNENVSLADLDLVHDGTGYFFANLPDSLVLLTFLLCKHIEWGHFGEFGHTQILERLHFPPNLSWLDIDRCNLATVKNFVFPPTLKVIFPTEFIEDAGID